MKQYLSDYGLINANKEEQNSENAPLFTMYYLIHRCDEVFFQTLYSFIVKCETSKKGLYHQFPVMFDTKDDYMSPDQLIAFLACLQRSPRSTAIWDYLCSHWFTYDNLSGKTNSERFMQPAAILFAGYQGSRSRVIRLVCQLGLVITSIISCASKPDQTSGKLKAYLIMKSANLHWTNRLCTWLISTTKFKSWSGVFLHYFKGDLYHPVIVARLGELKDV